MPETIDYKQFLNDKFFNIPNSYTEGYLCHLDSKLNEYISKLQTLKENNISLGDDSNMDIDFVIESQRRFIFGLINTVKTYLSGQPYNAYKIFEDAMMLRRQNNYGINYLVGLNDCDLYRIRANHNDSNFTIKDLFHIPFEKREIVSSQRYSIAGFPSLYLGKSVYTCWIELGRPQITDISISRFQERSALRLLNLRWDPNITDDPRYNYSDLIRWPLVAACSTLVKNRGVQFKPEYILPQILLQWVRNNNTQFDGIIYNSTQIGLASSSGHSWFSNVVIPVKDNADQGYCTYLKKGFLVSEPLTGTYILEEIEKTELPRISKHDEFMVNMHIDRPSQLIAYSDTSLYKIEMYLLTRKLFEIDDQMNLKSIC